FDTPSRRDTFVTDAVRALPGPSLQLAAIVMLARHDGPVELLRLEAREAFSRTLGQSYAFSLDEPARKRAMMGQYMRLVNRVPTYQLASPSGLEHLDQICEAIESVARPLDRA